MENQDIQSMFDEDREIKWTSIRIKGERELCKVSGQGKILPFQGPHYDSLVRAMMTCVLSSSHKHKGLSSYQHHMHAHISFCAEVYNMPSLVFYSARSTLVKYNPLLTATSKDDLAAKREMNFIFFGSRDVHFNMFDSLKFAHTNPILSSRYQTCKCLCCNL